MRITSIGLKNFRAFYGEHIINLGNDGKNLLVYGENGSGKSSLFLALQAFIFAHQNPSQTLKPFRNIFADDTADAYLNLTVKTDSSKPAQTFSWSDSGHDDTFDDPIFRRAALTSGFLEYKVLQETYFLQIKDGRVNIFDLLVRTLLG